MRAVWEAGTGSGMTIQAGLLPKPLPTADVLPICYPH